MSELLKESIADAKAIRETAIANAKTFLEENFATSMKNMFAEKLKEEAEEQEADGEEKIEEKLSTSNIGGEKLQRCFKTTSCETIRFCIKK